MDSSNAMRSDTSADLQLSRRIWLEVGHASEPRRGPAGRAARDWRVWVRGVAGADIAALVRKVVFQLRPENLFPYPERIFDEPPFLVKKCGNAPTEIIISVYLKHTTKPERIRLQYGPLFREAERSSAESQCVCYDVQNPSEGWRAALLQARAARGRGGVLAVLPDSDEVRPVPRPLLATGNKCAEALNAPLQLKRIAFPKGSSDASPVGPVSPQPQKKGKLKRGYEFVEPIDPKTWESLKPTEACAVGQPHTQLQERKRKKAKLAKDYRHSMSAQSSTVLNSQVSPNTHEFVAPIDSSLWENMNVPDSKLKRNLKSSTHKGSVPLTKTCLQSSDDCNGLDDASSAFKSMLRQGSALQLMEGELELLWRQCAARGRYEQAAAALPLPPLPALRRAPALPAAARRALAAASKEPDHVLQ